MEEDGRNCSIARLRRVQKGSACGGAAGFTWCMLLVVTLEVLQLRASHLEPFGWLGQLLLS